MGRPRKTTPEPWECEAVADEVREILRALEIEKVDAQAQTTLQRWVYRADKLLGGDRGNIVLTLRAITESEGNGPDALLDPILCAVSAVCRPEFTRQGVAFIAAFDTIDLRSLYRTMRDLRCFTRDDVSRFLTTAIQSRLCDVLGPCESRKEIRRALYRRRGARESAAPMREAA